MLSLLFVVLAGAAAPAVHAGATGTNAKDIAATIASCATGAGVLCGGLYFLAKALQGFLYPDLKLELALRNGPSDGDGACYLAVDVTLTRGQQGALDVTDAIAIFRQDGREPQIVPLNARRYKVVGNKKKTRVQRDPLVWSELAFIMAPTDATRFSVYTRIVAGEPCTVDVAVTGYQLKTPAKSQWRASAVYLPGVEAEPAS